jgi:S1-C subfamily serine protease
MGNGGAMGFTGEEPDDEIPGAPPFDDDPDLPQGSLPHPLDRLWLHPSELSPLAAASATKTKPLWTTTLVAGAAGAILTLGVLGAVGALGRGSDHVAEPSVVPTSTPIATARAVAIAVADSVVAVSVRDQFGARRGSGVYIRRSGEILTSDRLIGQAKKIDVTTADGVVRPARVEGRDSTTDLVLLDVDSAKPATQPTGPSGSNDAKALAEPAQFSARAVRAGDTVWVVGAPSPGDSAPWMSSGLVASTDSLVAISSGPTTSGLLETAAAASSGATGGALVDNSGDVTGIILSPVGDERMTYAVPIGTALSIANDLRAHGYVTHGALGINGINATAGPTVSGIVAGGPAARAGVHVGDVIDSVDNHEVYSMDDVMAFVRHDRPGQPVELTLERGKTSVKVRVTLTSMITP